MSAPPKRILLVEDNPDDEELARHALSSSRIEVELVVARDGVAALEHLFGGGQGKGSGPLPALVLLDLKLPKVDGFEVLRRIRSETRTSLLPVVVLSSSGEERDVAECYAAGANGYVTKPVGFEEFSRAVAELCAYWLAVNRPAAPPPGGVSPRAS